MLNMESEYSYKVVLNPRAKRLSFSISPVDGLSIIMPRQLSDKYVKKMLRKYNSWIKQQLKKIEPQQKQFAKYKFQHYGNTILHGLPHELNISTGTRKIEIIDNVVNISNQSIATRDIKKLYFSWIKRTARDNLKQKLDNYSEQMNVKYRRLSIRGQKTMWGSCSQQGSISMNWKLMCAPIYAQDYVVIHELSHINHLNHSKSFWKLVNQHTDNATISKNWLKRYGDLIQFVTSQYS
ncbi:MAG: SprT family zinc-dependent metalloprotease [bacterium]|nr:SprT family zinc-dependent metalloprotease [bacterium]